MPRGRSSTGANCVAHALLSVLSRRARVVRCPALPPLASPPVSTTLHKDRPVKAHLRRPPRLQNNHFAFLKGRAVGAVARRMEMTLARRRRALTSPHHSSTTFENFYGIMPPLHLFVVILANFMHLLLLARHSRSPILVPTPSSLHAGAPSFCFSKAVFVTTHRKVRIFPPGVRAFVPSSFRCILMVLGCVGHVPRDGNAS